MFDDVFGMITQCAETFRGSVRDSFGESIINDVTDPIRNQIGLLRSFSDEFQRSSLNIAQVLQTVRSKNIDEGYTR